MTNAVPYLQKVKALLRPVAAFFLPLLPALSIALLILSFLVALAEKKWKQVNLSVQMRNPWIILPAAFYLLHIAGLLWSQNLSFGWFDLQIKLSLIILPLLFMISPAADDESKKIFSGFIAGCLSACIIMLVTAAVKFSIVPEKNYFFYIDLVKPLHFHPTYITVYLSVAALLVLNRIFRQEYRLRPYDTAVLFFTGLTIALLSAKMAELTFLVSLIILLFLMLRWHSRQNSIGVLLLFIVFCISCDYVSKTFYNRFEAVEATLSKLEQKSEPSGEKASESTDTRILIWKNGWILFRENWLSGTGTGDIKDEIIKVHQRTGFQAGVERRYGPHNQFLQTGSALGIAGLICLVLMLLLPAISAVRQQNIPAFLFLMLLGFNFMAESMLEVQSGVLFTGFFYGLFSGSHKG